MYILYSHILVPDVDTNVPILQTDDDDSFEEGPEDISIWMGPTTTSKWTVVAAS